MAAVGELQPAMGAGADAGIFAIAPVDEVVPALGAGHGVVGNLVGRQAGRVADFLGDGIEIGGGVVVGHGQLAGLAQREEGRVRLDGELVERQVIGGESRAPRVSSPAQASGVWPGRA